jgi:hypothetical protein
VIHRADARTLGSPFGERAKAEIESAAKTLEYINHHLDPKIGASELEHSLSAAGRGRARSGADIGALRDVLNNLHPATRRNGAASRRSAARNTVESSTYAGNTMPTSGYPYVAATFPRAPAGEAQPYACSFEGARSRVVAWPKK